MQKASWIASSGRWEGNDISESRFLPFSYKGGVIIRYKFKINPRIRNFIEYQIETLPENERILSEIRSEKMPNIISRYGAPPGRTNDLRRPTEETAISIVTDIYILQLKLSVSAVRSVYDKLSPEDKELIRMKYWSHNTFNADAIAMKLNMAYTTVYDRLNNILIAVGRRLGYVNMF